MGKAVFFFAFVSLKILPNIFIFNLLQEKRRKKSWYPRIRDQRSGIRKAPARSIASIVHEREVILCKEGSRNLAVGGVVSQISCQSFGEHPPAKAGGCSNARLWLPGSPAGLGLAPYQCSDDS